MALLINRSTPQKYTPNSATVITTTTVVACTSLREGVVTWRNSVRTSVKKLLPRAGNAFSLPPTLLSSICATADFAIAVSQLPLFFETSQPRLYYFDLAGAVGFEPTSPVLETGSLAIELRPLCEHSAVSTQPKP